MDRISNTRRRVNASIIPATILALVVAVPNPASGDVQQSDTGRQTSAGAFLYRNGRFTPLGGIKGAAVAGHVGVNNRGQVVGFYSDAQGAIRSFVKDARGRVTKFAVPGAAATLAAGINDRGQAAGTYLDRPLEDGPPLPGTVHGFIRQPNGRISTIDPPAPFDGGGTIGINNHGQTVGQALDANGQGVGLLRDPGGRLTVIRLPGKAAVGDFLGLNDRGQVVGYWDDRPDARAKEPNSQHGFLWQHGHVTRLDVPRSLATGALGINDAGLITGSFDDAAGRHHGFVLRKGRYTTIDAPGRTVTDAWGINERGQIVIPDLGTGLQPITP